jgi:tRNA (guanine10-N2)-methyltransferase
MKLYVLQFLDDWQDFRYAEFLALLRLEGFDPNLLPAFPIHDPNVSENTYLDTSKPRIITERVYTIASLLQYLRENQIVQHFFIFGFEDESALIRIANRTVLVKNIYELWEHQASFEGLVGALRNNESNLLQSYLAQTDLSWSTEVIGFGRSFTMAEKQHLRTNVAFLSLPGPVNIKTPDVEMCLLVDYIAYVSNVKPKDDNKSPTVPCYFGRRLPTAGMKNVLKKYSLKTRPYLGPTSLNDELAFILANMVGCKSGMVSYEPFVGTGSIVVALAHLGIFCIGSDIDPRVLRGEMYAGTEETATIAKKQRQQKQKELGAKASGTLVDKAPVDICTNFRTYDLPTPELIRMDAHAFSRHFRPQMNNFFDVIVTDPPYGIRAGARKSGKVWKATSDDTTGEYTIPEERRHDHIPSTQVYPVEEVMLDLLDNAAKSLVIGGPLVYLIPTTYDFVPNDLPRHPCLQLEEICHQQLSSRHGRRAVVMRKICHLDADKEAEFNQYKVQVLSQEVFPCCCILI